MRRKVVDLGDALVAERPFYFDRCTPFRPFGKDCRVTAGVIYATDEASARAQFRDRFVELNGAGWSDIDSRYRFLDLATVTERPHGNIAVITVMN